MTPDLVSIIIPAYNADKTIGRCLDSIITQTHKNIEIIIINDGSNDNTASIINKYAISDIRFKIITRTNHGVSSSRNLGLQLAKGEFICFVDADDTINPQFVQRLLESIKTTKSEIAICNVTFIYGKHKQYPLKLENGTINRHDYISNILHDAQGFVANKLYRKSFIAKDSFDPKILVCEDFLFNVKLGLKLQQAVLVNEYLYNYYQTKSSATRNRYTGTSATELIANKKILSIIKKHFKSMAPEYIYELTLSACRQKFLCKKAPNRPKGSYQRINNFIKENKNEIYHKIQLPNKLKIFIYEHYYFIVHILKKIKHNLG